MDNVRDDILSAALMLVAQKGFHGVVMSEVCREANVPAGAIYRYFPNKKRMIQALFEEVSTNYHHVIIAGCIPEMDVHDIFHTIWHNSLKNYHDFLPELHFLDQYFNSNFFYELDEEEKIKAAAPYSQYLRRGVEEGVLRDYPIYVLNSMMMGPLRNLLFTSLCSGHELSEKDIDMTFELCWKAISMV